VAVVLDTSVVVALMVADEPDHGDVRAWVETLDDDLVTTPLAVAEMDHLVTARGGPGAASHLWDDFAAGAYGVRWWADALAESIAIARAAPRLGLTDASLVALAHRLSTTSIATLDHRHFRSLMTADGSPFVLLPADAT
jgi:predicted nucleic acid-binding protein